MPYGRHLRSETRAGYRCHKISAERRTGLKKKFSVPINIKLSAIRRQSGLKHNRDLRYKGTAYRRRTGEYYIGLVLFNKRNHRFGIRFVIELSETVRIHDVHLIRAVKYQVICFTGNIVPDKHRAQFFTELGRKLPAFIKEFVNNGSNLTVSLFRVNPDTFI